MKTDEARVLYQAHKYSPIVERLPDATLFQKHFLMMMAVKDLNYMDTIDVKLEGIAKGVGVEFKNKRR